MYRAFKRTCGYAVPDAFEMSLSTKHTPDAFTNKRSLAAATM
jgi:hypothetical protein